jgi:hypothetical protein
MLQAAEKDDLVLSDEYFPEDDCAHVCEPAWNIDPLAGVIGVQY